MTLSFIYDYVISPKDNKIIIKSNNLIKQIRLKDYFINQIDQNVNPGVNRLILSFNNKSNGKYGEFHPGYNECNNNNVVSESSIHIPYINNDQIVYNDRYVNYTILSIPDKCPSSNRDALQFEVELFGYDYSTKQKNKIGYNDMSLTFEIDFQE